jgi:hypothetical protein
MTDVRLLDGEEIIVEAEAGGKDGMLKQTEWTITNQRIIKSSGRLSSSTENTPFDKVVGSISTSQSMTQSLKDLGNVTFEIQIVKDVGGESGKVGDRDVNEMEQDVVRETIEMESIKDYENVAGEIRQLQQQSDD